MDYYIIVDNMQVWWNRQTRRFKEPVLQRRTGSSPVTCTIVLKLQCDNFLVHESFDKNQKIRVLFLAIFILRKD